MSLESQVGPRGPFRAVVFGASGAAGSGVLEACLGDSAVSEVQALVRRPLGVSHDKLVQMHCDDFATLEGASSALDGVDVVYYCLGRAVSQVDGEAAYRTLTFDYAMAAATELRKRSPQATLHFISGSGTNPKSRMMWARVKGETELALRECGLGGLVCWRPGMILAAEPPDNLPLGYRLAYPVMRSLYFLRSSSVTALHLGQAMLQATFEDRRSGVLENKEIRELAERYASTR